MAGRLGKSIDIGNIGKYFDRQVVRKVVAATTLEWQKRVINETPVDTGRLRNDWRVNIKPFVGEITNRVEYADAVIYGVNMPPSWLNATPSGWRTLTPSPTGNRVNRATRQGYPDLIGKELSRSYLVKLLRRL